MKKRWLGVLCVLLLIFGGYYLFKANSTEKASLTGVYKDENGELRGQLLENSKKDDSKYFAYIEGEFVDETIKEFTSDFSLNKLYFQDLTMEIPDYFQTFGGAEVSNLVSLINEPREPFNYCGTDGLSIYISDNEDNLTTEGIAENIKSNAKFPGASVREFENVTVDGNHLRAYYNGDYRRIEKEFPENQPTDFKLYRHTILKNNKIYDIEYSYRDEAIGKKVIEILDSSLSIK